MSSSVRANVRDDGVATLTLADPAKRNALSHRLSQDLAAAVGEVLGGGARAIVLDAEPPVFCAGGSLDDLLARSRPLAETYAGFLALAAAPVPTIAAELEAQRWSVEQPYFEETVRALRAKISSR